MYKLLVADDNKIGRDAIEYMIHTNALPFDVSQAKNGQEALQMIHDTRYDCVITDIKMPRMTGIELVKTVSGEEGHTPVFVICSGYREFEDAKAAIEYGVQNYLVKPLNVSEFLKTMREIVNLLHREEAKKTSDLEEGLCHVLIGKVPVRGTEMSLLMEKVTRLIVICSKGNRQIQRKDEIRTKINALSGHAGQFVNLDKCWDAVLYFGNDSEKGKLNEFLLNLKLIYKEYGDEQVFIGVSRHVSSLASIPNELDETMRCCEKKFFQSQPKIFFAGESEEGSDGSIASMEEEIHNLIVSGRIADVKAAILQYLDIVSQTQNASVIFTKFQISNFVKQMLQQYSLSSGSSFYKIVEEIGYAQTVSELKGIIVWQMNNLILEHPLSREENDAVELAEKIIREEYAADLTLEYIAQRVYLSPSYLSRAFKEKTGTNLFSYLTDFRMETSKRLLKESNIKIVEISKKVGYDNPSYFGQVFKQHYGLTPKKFRSASGRKA